MYAARSPRCAIAIGVALGIASATALGDSSDSTTSPQTPWDHSAPITSASTGPAATVTLGSDVAPATVTKVASYVTRGDSVGATAGIEARACGVSADTGSVSVIALNASGGPVAALRGAR